MINQGIMCAHVCVYVDYLNNYPAPGGPVLLLYLKNKQKEEKFSFNGSRCVGR